MVFGFVTLIVGLLSALIVHYMIQNIIKEDYKLKILFDNNSYEELNNEEI